MDRGKQVPKKRMKIKASGSLSNVEAIADIKKFVSIFQDQVITAINGNISFSDNVFAKLVNFTFPGANKTIGVAHGLGNLPAGYFLVGSNAALSLFDGDQKNTIDTLFLQSNAAGVARVMVFG